MVHNPCQEFATPSAQGTMHWARAKPYQAELPLFTQAAQVCFWQAIVVCLPPWTKNL